MRVNEVRVNEVRVNEVRVNEVRVAAAAIYIYIYIYRHISAMFVFSTKIQPFHVSRNMFSIDYKPEY